VKKIIFAFAAAGLLAGSAPSFASPCKDAKGKFMKCPAAKSATCRDSKGKFIKCPAAPAKPKVCKDAKGKFMKCK
jgi:hypothetical protein